MYWFGGLQSQFPACLHGKCVCLEWSGTTLADVCGCAYFPCFQFAGLTVGALQGHCLELEANWGLSKFKKKKKKIIGPLQPACIRVENTAYRMSFGKKIFDCDVCKKQCNNSGKFPCHLYSYLKPHWHYLHHAPTQEADMSISEHFHSRQSADHLL